VEGHVKPHFYQASEIITHMIQTSEVVATPERNRANFRASGYTTKGGRAFLPLSGDKFWVSTLL